PPARARGGGQPRAAPPNRHNGAMATSSPRQIAFDLRRNLINVLGEDHYPYAEFLYHELAANAYDADATEVEIFEETVVPAGPGRSPIYNITIRDNGIGMDDETLPEWFRL